MSKPQSKQPPPFDRADAIACLEVDPTVSAATTIAAWLPKAPDAFTCITGLQKHVQKIRNGNLGTLEAALVAQSLSLDKIANALMRQAAELVPAPHWETYLRLGLEAQVQCRLTIEAALRTRLAVPSPIPDASTRGRKR